MAKLHDLMTAHREDRFEPSRLEAILASVTAHRARDAAEIDARLEALHSQLVQVEDKLRRIYKMVEDDVAEIDDILKARMAELKEDRDRTRCAIEKTDASVSLRQEITPEVVAAFAASMCQNITSGDIAFRKAYIRAIVDRVEVDDHIIRIIGDKSTLEHAVAGRTITSVGVRSFERKWSANFPDR